MQRIPPNPRNADHVTRIEPNVIDEADVGTITLSVFDNRDSRVVVDGGSDTWEFVINEEIAYSRWDHHELPDWIEPVLSQIGIRALRAEEEGV
ncbi:hypothetical protein [Halobellus limi]|uniref:Uncharacterized protein n=1 Tax=Halobellus limi TaxID=699433 RepID=A0A1H5VWD7_9EURY|nr:hypothetical protein [Halobellus limi]QCC46604.1 hypothetical protein DV707_02350 [Halobellus limi]SEF91296.1 hypothetical protein SAMN04488133_1085 [Halobellus limi]